MKNELLKKAVAHAREFIGVAKATGYILSTVLDPIGRNASIGEAYLEARETGELPPHKMVTAIMIGIFGDRRMFFAARLGVRRWEREAPINQRVNRNRASIFTPLPILR
jgi:hypothetical protein